MSALHHASTNGTLLLIAPSLTWRSHTRCVRHTVTWNLLPSIINITTIPCSDRGEKHVGLVAFAVCWSTTFRPSPDPSSSLTTSWGCSYRQWVSGHLLSMFTFYMVFTWIFIHRQTQECFTYSSFSFSVLTVGPGLKTTILDLFVVEGCRLQQDDPLIISVSKDY